MKRRRKSDISKKKEQAHDIIRELEELGIPKRVVYLKLARKLKLPKEECHFAQMRSIDEVNRGITALQNIKTGRLQKLKRDAQKREQRKQSQQIIPAVEKTKKVLGQAEIKRMNERVAAQNNALREVRIKHPILSKYFPFLMKWMVK